MKRQPIASAAAFFVLRLDKVEIHGGQRRLCRERRNCNRLNFLLGWGIVRLRQVTDDSLGKSRWREILAQMKV